MAPLVILGVFIKKLLYSFMNCAQGYIFNLLFNLENRVREKKTTNYVSDKFLKDINFNYVPEHLRNFKIYMQGRTRLTSPQRRDPRINSLFNRRQAEANTVKNWSNVVVRNANRLRSYIADNNLIAGINRIGGM